MRQTALINRPNRPNCHPNGRQSQHGQALILAVICLLVLCLGLFMVFDTGQVVSKKVQLTNAADAAAYSVAIEQARALNTAAYLNRAEVANQIAIAQIVSIQSYANYADSMAGRTANVLFAAGDALDGTVALAELGAALQELASTLKELQDAYAGALSAVDTGESVAVSALNALNGLYSIAQQDVFYAFSVNSGVTTVNKVIRDNTLDAGGISNAKLVPAGEGLLAAQLACFDGLKKPICFGPSDVTSNSRYTVRYTIPQQGSAGDHIKRTWAADRVANVMMRARDHFSASRGGHFPISPFPLFKIDAVKKGGTDLVDYNRWVAADVVGIQIKIGCEWMLPCWKKAGILGLGAAAAIPSSMEGDSPSTIISPGISLTKATGGQGGYHTQPGQGWYSPYSDKSTKPYQGALSFASDADLAAHPTDQGTNDVIADLKYLTPWQNVVPGYATPQTVAWIKSSVPSINLHQFGDNHPSGLQDYNDVAPDKAVEPYQTASNDRNDVGPIFTVYVKQDDDKVRTGAVIGMEGGDLKLQNKGMGKAIAAMASAQVYYDRPWWNLPFLDRHTYSAGADNNKMREFGNLFEPYWQVRLVATPKLIKAGLLGNQMAGL